MAKATEHDHVLGGVPGTMLMIHWHDSQGLEQAAVFTEWSIALKGCRSYQRIATWCKILGGRSKL